MSHTLLPDDNNGLVPFENNDEERGLLLALFDHVNILTLTGIFHVHSGETSRKAVVDYTHELIRTSRLTREYFIEKSALAERIGRRKHQYLDGHAFQELEAIRTMTDKERVKYATLTTYRKRRWYVKHILTKNQKLRLVGKHLLLRDVPRFRQLGQ